MEIRAINQVSSWEVLGDEPFMFQGWGVKENSTYQDKSVRQNRTQSVPEKILSWDEAPNVREGRTAVYIYDVRCAHHTACANNV